MTPERHAQLKECYLYVFDIFATGISEIATHMGVSKASARKMLSRLEEAGLVGSYDVNQEAQGAFRRGEYKELCWQANVSYDYESHEEAEFRFLDAIPAPIPPVKSKPTSAYAVAVAVEKALRKKYGTQFGEIHIWTAKQMEEWSGYSKAPTVVWEGGEHEWAITDSWWLQEQCGAGTGFYLEPHNSFMISVYPI